MEFNANPYYDDFEDNAANNNYMRIMFKPGYAVQARELTQIQSILQNQIKQFGDHVFQDGSPVIGGNLTLDNKIKFLKLEETFNNEDIEIDLFDGAVVRSADGLTQAKVVTTYYPTDGTPTLLLRYITANEFAEGATIKIAGTTTSAKAISSGSNGSAIVCSINEGVFYVNGFFVKVLDQSTPVSPYSVTANVKIGLEIDDTFVDADVDTTLLDPALGSFNYQAPGADRYQFNLRLSTRPLDTVVDESQFFELMRVENGAITKQVKYPIYSELEKTLARRTFDESGDYTVRPFKATVIDGSNANNYTVAIEPGKAYVKGFEFETIGTVKIDVPKPRSAADVKSLVDTDVDTSYGKFVYVTSFRGSNGGFINIAAFEKVDIHCVTATDVNANIAGQTTSNTFYYQNTKIGSVRVKNFTRYSADAFDSVRDSNGVYLLYLSDPDIRPTVAKVTAASSNANTIRFQDKFSPADNAYLNVAVTILPVRLDSVANVYATALQDTFTVNANASGTFATKVNVGDTIRVGEFVKLVTAVATGNLTVNSAFEYTVANSATNPVQVFKQTAMTQNVAGQTRTIIRYNGAARTAFLDKDFDNGGVANVDTVFQLNFGIDDAKSFVSGPVTSNALNAISLQNASMNVSTFGKLENNDTFVEDPQRGTLIFKLPGSYIKRDSINNADYYYNKIVQNRGNTGTANQFALSQGSGLDSFETVGFTDSTTSIQDNLIVVVRNNNGNTSYPNGSILQLTAANVTIGSPATSITFDTYVPDILTVDIMLRVKQNDTEDLIRTKSFYSNTTYSYSSFSYPTSNSLANTTVTLGTLGEVAKIDIANGLVWLTNVDYNKVGPGGTISLFVPDVVKVRRIMMSNTTVVPQGDANTSDVTSRFLIDYGQRDDRYEHAKLILKPGADTPTGMLLIHLDLYHHIYAAGANVSFFSAASYPQAQYDGGAIPIYTSSSGTTYKLRDCLDFRPTQILGSNVGAYIVPNLTFPDDVTELSVDYYLPRIDKIVLSKDKEFRVIQGKTANIPFAPSDIDDAMTLFVINVPPYAADIREVKMTTMENRRLTMKELSSLNKRVERLEFFTSLDNVERTALADPTQYADGTEKEKYGVVGENFTNFNIADFKNPDFAAAVEGGFMIPKMDNRPLEFKPISTTDITKNMRTLSLDYTETPAISQGVCSKAVPIAPFLFGRFNGQLDIFPQTDYWVSDKLKPEVVTPPTPIIEQPITIRDRIIEDYEIITIRFPYLSAESVIIETPNTDPVENANSIVVVTPVEPPPPHMCPAPWMQILLSDGTHIPAGELKVGMSVRTMHEDTLAWGDHVVTHVESVQDIERMEFEFDHINFVCSKEHKFYKDDQWIDAKELNVGDQLKGESGNLEVKAIRPYVAGEVVKITVDGAHTYICENLFSHNKEPTLPVLPPPIVAPQDPPPPQPTPPDPVVPPVEPPPILPTTVLPPPIPPVEPTVPWEPIVINIDPLWGGGGSMTLWYTPYILNPNFFVAGYTGVGSQTTESDIPTGTTPIVATNSGFQEPVGNDTEHTGGGGGANFEFDTMNIAEN